MIEHSLVRSPGGRRYSSEDRRAARALTAAAFAPTVTAAGIAAMTDPAGIRVVVDVLFELESNRLRRPVTVEILRGATVVAPASGDLDSIVNGRRASTDAIPPVVFPAAPAGTPAVRLTWTDPRPVNVVEVHGDAVAGQVTAASIFTLDAGGVETFRGSAASDAGRLVIPVGTYADPVTCYGIRAQLDGMDALPTAVVEVDPMYLLDLSDEVAEVAVTWSRETDPGTADSPVGNYEASTVELVLDDTAGQWNPATSATLDVGHRIEVAFGVQYLDGDGLTVEELFPAGVFYSEPFDTDSDSSTVTINGTDRLGRSSEVGLSEEVLVDVTVADLLTRLAREYLDLDEDQVTVDPGLGATVLPYAYPSGNLGSYLADVAKAVAGTVHVDALDRLVLARRSDTTADTVAVIDRDTSLIRFRRPPGYDVTTSVVTVTASPLVEDPTAELWAMPPGGIRVAVGETYRLIATYSTAPAVNGATSGVVADGAYTITGETYYSDRAEVLIRNDAATELTVADLRVSGNALVPWTYTARREHAPSVARYGPRELAVDARLAQTQAQVETIADVLLDAFRSLDDAGIRRLPDLTLDALGLLHVTAGDRVTITDAARGVGGDYAILSRRLAYAGGSLLLNDVRVREVPGDAFLILDVGLLDDGLVVG